jgi:hypothetical protein
MVSKFDDELILDRKAPDFTDVADQTGLRHGPCAMGNTADGHSLSCMHVLLLQDVGGRVATATGVSGRLTRKDRPKKQGRWMVNTQLAKGSKQFVAGKPALAMAMAISKDEDGGTEIERWSQAVTIVSAG